MDREAPRRDAEPYIRLGREFDEVFHFAARQGLMMRLDASHLTVGTVRIRRSECRSDQAGAAQTLLALLQATYQERPSAERPRVTTTEYSNRGAPWHEFTLGGRHITELSG
jgi:hypothetical protein